MEEQGNNFASFDSSYFYIRDLHELGANAHGVNEHETPQNRINVWIISDPEMGCMIPKILKPEDLEYTMAFIMPDLEQPWDIMKHCEKWMKVLKDAVFSLTPKLELKLLEKLKGRIVDLCKTYEEPEFDKEGKFISKRITKAPVLDGNDDINEIDISVVED